ncbi:MAG: hypothetical protein ACOX1P_07125 [Thermoguttaceae bacterium]|jgi:hypothetical protein
MECFCTKCVRACLLAVMLCGPAIGQETGLTRQHHPWGQFQPGAWSLVRVTTESFEGGQMLKSVTETSTTLSGVDETGVTLKVEVAVLVGGKRLDTDPQTLRQGFHGEVAGNEPAIKDLGRAELVVENRRVDCRVLELEFPRPGGRRVSKIWYSDAVDPYVIRRVTAVYGDDLRTPISKTSVEVVSLEAPCAVFRNFRTAARVKSVHEDASGTTTTWASTSSVVPGGVICCSSQQVDKEGRLVLRSNMQLLDYGLQPSQGRSGLFWRWRNTRGRR